MSKNNEFLIYSAVERNCLKLVKFKIDPVKYHDSKKKMTTKLNHICIEETCRKYGNELRVNVTYIEKFDHVKLTRSN